MSPGRVIHNLALTGFMGSGKSTVGQLVAARLGFDFVDTDRLIEQRAGCTVATIFATEGEAAFRAHESAVVAELAERRQTVIATGGGLGANLEHLEKLKQHALIVCLWITAHAAWERVRYQARRPLLRVPDPVRRITELLAQREPAYQQADVLIHTGARSLPDVVLHVVREFRDAVSVPHHEGATPHACGGPGL